MAKKKQDSEYTDAKGDLHKQFANGSCEIYIGGFDKDQQYVEITDEADESVSRKRFMPYVAPPIQETLRNTDAPEVSKRFTPDQVQAEFDKADELFKGKTFEDGAVVDDDAVPGIDSLDPDAEQDES